MARGGISATFSTAVSSYYALCPYPFRPLSPGSVLRRPFLLPAAANDGNVAAFVTSRAVPRGSYRSCVDQGHSDSD